MLSDRTGANTVIAAGHSDWFTFLVEQKLQDTALEKFIKRN